MHHPPPMFLLRVPYNLRQLLSFLHSSAVVCWELEFSFLSPIEVLSSLPLLREEGPWPEEVDELRAAELAYNQTSCSYDEHA